jgi:hypothetical protein
MERRRCAACGYRSCPALVTELARASACTDQPTLDALAAEAFGG